MKEFTVVQLSGEPVILNDWGFTTTGDPEYRGSHQSPEAGHTFSVRLQDEISDVFEFSLLNKWGDVLAEGVGENWHKDERDGYTVTFYGVAKVYNSSQKRITRESFSFHVKES